MNDCRLPDGEIESLEVLHRELPEKRQADRVKAIILLGSGWTPSQLAQALLIDRSTVRRFYRHYQKGGVKKLLATHYPPHQGYLSTQQKQELDHYLQHLHITAKSIAAYVEERFGIRYSERGMTELLPIFFIWAGIAGFRQCFCNCCSCSSSRMVIWFRLTCANWVWK